MDVNRVDDQLKLGFVSPPFAHRCNKVMMCNSLFLTGGS